MKLIPSEKERIEQSESSSFTFEVRPPHHHLSPWKLLILVSNHKREFLAGKSGVDVEIFLLRPGSARPMISAYSTPRADDFQSS